MAHIIQYHPVSTGTHASLLPNRVASVKPWLSLSCLSAPAADPDSMERCWKGKTWENHEKQWENQTWQNNPQKYVSFLDGVPIFSSCHGNCFHHFSMKKWLGLARGNSQPGSPAAACRSFYQKDLRTFPSSKWRLETWRDGKVSETGWEP